jgi:hypothetical protein
MEKEKTRDELITETLQEHQGPDFLTYIARPKYAEQIDTYSDLSPDSGKDVAILVCGPMVYENHFTRDSIRLYRKYYPQALIILSTGEDEDADYLDDLQGPDVVVLKSRKPENSGRDDREWGRILIYTGVQEAVRREKMYCFRTPTSARAYAPNLLSYFRSLQDVFPLSSDYLQHKRLIFCGCGSLKYMPFCFSIFFQFGHVDDMSKYWEGLAIFPDDIPEGGSETSIALRAETNMYCYFNIRYLRNIGMSFKPKSLRDSWRVMADLFCLVDYQMLDLASHISPENYKEIREAIYQPRTSQMFSFRDWLILYQNRDRIDSAPEHILDMPLGELIPK